MCALDSSQWMTEYPDVECPDGCEPCAECLEEWRAVYDRDRAEEQARFSAVMRAEYAEHMARLALCAVHTAQRAIAEQLYAVKAAELVREHRDALLDLRDQYIADVLDGCCDDDDGDDGDGVDAEPSPDLIVLETPSQRSQLWA